MNPRYLRNLAPAAALAAGSLAAAAARAEDPHAPGADAMNAHRWTARVATHGEVRLARDGRELAVLRPEAADPKWAFGAVQPALGAAPGAAPGVIRVGAGSVLDCRFRAEPAGTDSVELRYTLAPRAETALNSLHVELSLPVAEVAGRDVALDGEPVAIPPETGPAHVRAGPARLVALPLAGGGRIELRFPAPTPVLFQDNRQWGPQFVVRAGSPGAKTWKAGESLEVAFTLAVDGPLAVERDGPTTIEAGPEWIPLAAEIEIEPGSALDFSALRPTASPAGALGRVIARPDGRFAFEQAPDRPVRFYGANLCFSACFPAPGQAETLAVRFARLGYNAVRIHHYESELLRPSFSAFAEPPSRPPDATREVAAFEAPSGAGERYRARLAAYLHPPATGDYVFRIAADDDGALLLSPGASPDGKRRIAAVRGWTGRREWTKHPEQTSAPVRLEAGRAYYLEAAHEQGGLGDHLAVAWSGPGVPEGVVAGEHLSLEPEGPRGKARWEQWRQGARADSVTPDPGSMERLDALVAAMARHGIYVTTDLFVSRPVPAAEIWPGAAGDCGGNEYKMAVPVNARAWENWKAFARALLGHVNPHRGLRWADDPAVAWLSMINEGNFANFAGRLSERLRPDWQAAWNRWLARAYPDAAALAAAWGADPGGDPAAGTVPWSGDAGADTPRGRDTAAFCAATERETFARMAAFLRDEVKTKALLTNANGWSNRLADHAGRSGYDYVDDHFYVDHPHFLDRDWQLPSLCDNANPIAAGAPGGRGNAFVRRYGKPFTISEFNYSAPGRFRGVGGILTGALGALQDWGVLWRFGYSHSRDAMFEPARMGYFDLATDPLNAAADRATLCLFLRGDLPAAPVSVAIAMTEDELLGARRRNVAPPPPWSGLAWVARVGAAVAERPGRVDADIVLPLAWRTVRREWSGGTVLEADPYGPAAGEAVLAEIRRRTGAKDDPTDPARKVYRAAGGALLLDGPAGRLVLDTPRTAGGHAAAGGRIETAAGTFAVLDTDATVWVSALDGAPIRESRRLLAAHLTDLQNSGARYAEKARQTLLDWGGLPHLVRAGRAEIALRVANPAGARAWALSPGGRRIAPVATEVRDGMLVLRLDARGPEGARMLYEIARAE